MTGVAYIDDSDVAVNPFHSGSDFVPVTNDPYTNHPGPLYDQKKAYPFVATLKSA